MSQKLPVNNFEWIKETSQFNEDFTKRYIEESDEGYFLKVDVQCPKTQTCHFYLKGISLKKSWKMFGKAMENVDIKLVTTERRRNYLVPEPNYYTTKFFAENLLAIGMKKTEITMKKPVYSRLSILDLSETVMYEFWYDYIKPKYGENGNLCYMDIGSFITHVKT